MSAGTWAYDGSLPGLAALVLRSLESGEAPEAVLDAALKRPAAEEGWLWPEAAARAPLGEGALSGREGEAALDALLGASRRLYAATLRAWMSEESVETELLGLAADFRARGELAFADYGRPSLRRLAEALRRVNWEVHKLEGFARFSPRPDPASGGERYVALLEPDHDVLPCLGPYFLRRFGRSPFALVDLRRAYALASVGEELELREGKDLEALMRPEAEGEEAELWRRYFRATENPARAHPRLQRALMPRRYWAQMVEMAEKA